MSRTCCSSCSYHRCCNLCQLVLRLMKRHNLPCTRRGRSLTALALLLVTIQIISGLFEHVEFGDPALSGAHGGSSVPFSLIRFLQSWPELAEAADNEETPVTFDGFMGKAVPEEKDEGKPDWNPGPVLDIGIVGCVEVDDIFPDNRIMDSAPGIGDERVGDVGIEEVAYDG